MHREVWDCELEATVWNPGDVLAREGGGADYAHPIKRRRHSFLFLIISTSKSLERQEKKEEEKTSQHL